MKFIRQGNSSILLGLQIYHLLNHLFIKLQKEAALGGEYKMKLRGYFTLYFINTWEELYQAIAGYRALLSDPICVDI